MRAGLRSLVLGGAELILLPIWGGDTAIGKARAMENHVFLAASGYDYPTYIMDPAGEILSEARKWKLSLVLAHQFLLQLPEKLRAAVLANVGSIIAFQLAGADAQVMAGPVLPGVLGELGQELAPLFRGEPGEPARLQAHGDRVANYDMPRRRCHHPDGAGD